MIEKELAEIISKAGANLYDNSLLKELTGVLPIITEKNYKVAEVNFLLGKMFYVQKNYSQAFLHYQLALTSADPIAEVELKSKTYSNLGVLFIAKSEPLEARKYLEQALVLKNQIGDEVSIANTLFNIANVSISLEDYIEAMQYYERAKKIFDKAGSTLMSLQCIYHLGLVYKDTENFDVALEYFIDVLSNITVEENPNLYCMLNLSLGEIYATQKNFMTAEKYLSKSLSLSRKYSIQLIEINSLTMLGDMYLEENKLDLSKDYILTALSIPGEHYHKAHTIANMKLGIIHFRNEELELSEQYLNEALRLTENHELIKYRREVLFHLIKFYDSTKNFQKAYEMQAELILLKDNYHEKKTDAKLAELKYNSEKERIAKETTWHEQKNKELEKEKHRADHLLKNILPDSVAEELKNTGTAKAVYYEDVTVLFTDFHEFSHITRLMQPQDLVEELHQCFKKFDEIVSNYNIEKIKTVGDAYLAVSGLPSANKNHAADIISAALEIRDFIAERKAMLGDKTFNIRIGIHSGAVVAGIVGVKKFAYDIWGDTVNTAARIEQNAVIGSVCISESTHELVKDKFKCEYKGEIEAKNIGNLKMYIIT